MEESAIKNNGIYESVEFNRDVIQTHGKSKITVQAKVIGSDSYTDYLALPPNNTVTTLNLPITTILKLTSYQPFNYTLPMYIPRYIKKTKIEDYLYEMVYGNIDYEYAYNYFKPASIGGCSSVRNGNWFGRNFDWLYDTSVQFIVHTPTTLNRLAVLGVSGNIPGVEQSNVDNPNIIIDGVDMFKLVPFYLLDGVNERHVFCSYNLTPLDNETEPTIEVLAKKEEKSKVNVLMLVRFILDRFSSAEQAISYLRDYTTIFFPEELIESKHQVHFMLGDSDSTYILEFINGELKVIREKFITNFNLFGVTLGKNKEIISGVNELGSGLERWNIILENYKSSNTQQGMISLMEKLKYSNCYGTPFWYTELTGLLDDNGDVITINTPPELCSEAEAEAILNYESRDREDPKTWITCHSSVYNIHELKLNISNQEENIRYIFEI